MKMENRIVLDYAMLLVLLMLMVKPMTGAFVHEALGIGFVVLTTKHLLNNKNFMKNMWKNKGRLILNILLLLSLLTVTVSGVMLSVSFFSFLNIPYREIIYTIHTSSAAALLILSLVHLFSHMKQIAAVLRKRKQARKERKQRSA